MCGITGQVRADGRAVDSALIHLMCEAIEHRGPDSRGVYASGPAGLGIQRLRIIDLETGDQPIFNEDGSVVVVLNGEIYNYRELRAELRARGHSFSSASDTEVIAHLYEERGPDCIRALHGMFGLAIWDVRRQRLVLARDRVGKKPLFYSLRDGVISFGSELNAVMRDSEISRDIDHAALDAYFAYRWVPAPLSAYRAVAKLPPASILIFEGGQARVNRYWQLHYEPKRACKDREEIHAELRDQVRRAVARRLLADVPLGAFLSGGVDSSVVVAAMAEASAQPVRTFSIGFDSDEYNELPEARLVAERFGTEHHEFVVRPDATEIIPKIVRHYGEPFADASAIPSFYLAKMTRQHVTVALNGDGGDETFAGYSRYQANMALEAFDRIPGPLRGAISRLVSRTPGDGRINSFASRLRRVGTAASLKPDERYAAYHSFLDGLDRRRLYTPEYRELLAGSLPQAVISEPWADSTARELVDRMLDVDVRTYLTDDLLVKIDIATMAYSLEARSPLLDHEYMQFAASLPPSFKVTSRAKKIGLREAFRGWVPDEILDARKRGFRLPFHDWFRGELRDYAYDLLLDPTARSRGMFDEAYVRELLQQHVEGARDNSQGIWSLVAFELWHREADSASATPTAGQVAA